MDCGAGQDAQPGIWSQDDVPKVQTYSVVTPKQVHKLGLLEMTLPAPEALRAVRFDGSVAYVITAALDEPWDPNPQPPPPQYFVDDPLFVIDLTNPALPQQRGELQIPGWIYHMETRGDRLVALGFDGNDSQGMINVSLFDVGDLDHPSMIDRVSFGGPWAGVVEDQNRIHKAFTLLDEDGLILVPFGAWEELEHYDGCYGSWLTYVYNGEIQLIDWSKNALERRGTARMVSQARRARLHQSRLIGMSNEEVRVFDIQNRDEPTLTDHESF